MRRFTSVHTDQRCGASRRGAASLDYILVIAATLPMLAIIIPNSRRIMALIYEMFAVQVSWPFM